MSVSLCDDWLIPTIYFESVQLLSLTFKVGKRLNGQYVGAVLDTQRAHFTVYAQGRIFKRWPYPFFLKQPTLVYL